MIDDEIWLIVRDVEGVYHAIEFVQPLSRDTLISTLQGSTIVSVHSGATAYQSAIDEASSRNRQA